jgi:hypothetical protein
MARPMLINAPADSTRSAGALLGIMKHPTAIEDSVQAGPQPSLYADLRAHSLCHSSGFRESEKNDSLGQRPDRRPQRYSSAYSVYRFFGDTWDSQHPTGRHCGLAHEGTVPAKTRSAHARIRDADVAAGVRGMVSQGAYHRRGLLARLLQKHTATVLPTKPARRTKRQWPTRWNASRFAAAAHPLSEPPSRVLFREHTRRPMVERRLVCKRPEASRRLLL